MVTAKAKTVRLKGAKLQRIVELRKLRVVLEDHYPSGYDPHKDRFADTYDYCQSVTALGTALRQAINLLEQI